MLLSQQTVQNHCIFGENTAGTAYATYTMRAVGHLEMVVSHQTEPFKWDKDCVKTVSNSVAFY
jgi:hypothetical protein